MGADMGTLTLLDRDAEPAQTIAVCEEQDRSTLLQMSQVCLAKGLSREAILRQWPVVRPDDTAISPLRSKNVQFPYARLRVKSALAVPLIFKGSVIGVMVLLKRKSEAFLPSSLALLDALATQIVVLIESGHFQSQTRALSIMEERQRLARELHDSVAQSLFTLCLAAEGLKASLVNPSEQARRALDLLVEQSTRVNREMRTLINELRPVDLRGECLCDALQAHVDSLRRSTNVQVTLSMEGEVFDLPVPIQRNLNRIAQEALNNIARHAGASAARVSLQVEHDVARLTVSDNGKGFDPQAVAESDAGSLGLPSMRERAEIIGGALLIRSELGKGTIVRAVIPLARVREGSPS